MVERQEPCVDILTQLAAVTSAMKKTGVAIFRVNMKRCLHEATTKGNKRQKELETALTRYIKLS
jgi:DNA-binding FrmR family transcriptional regulator